MLVVTHCCGQGKREFIDSSSGGNTFVLLDDIPLFWDAWDTMEYASQTRQVVPGGAVTIQEEGKWGWGGCVFVCSEEIR
jgi:alpha-mannosidase